MHTSFLPSGSSMSYEASTGLVQGSPYSSTPPPPYAALPQPYTCPPNVNYSQQQMATVSPYCGTGQPQTAVSYTKEGQWEGKCQTIIIPSAQQVSGRIIMVMFLESKSRRNNNLPYVGLAHFTFKSGNWLICRHNKVVNFLILPKLRSWQCHIIICLQWWYGQTIFRSGFSGGRTRRTPPPPYSA